MSKKAYYMDPDGVPVFSIAPGERDDYSVNFSAWLDENSIVGTPTVDVVGPLAVDTISVEGARVSFFLSGAVAGAKYTYTVTATDSIGRTRPVTQRVECKNRA